MFTRFLFSAAYKHLVKGQCALNMHNVHFSTTYAGLDFELIALSQSCAQHFVFSSCMTVETVPCAGCTDQEDEVEFTATMKSLQTFGQGNNIGQA